MQLSTRASIAMTTRWQHDGQNRSRLCRCLRLTLHITSQDAQPLLFSASRVRPGRSSSSSLSHGRPPEWRREAPVAAKHAEARRDQQSVTLGEQHTLAPHLSHRQVGIWAKNPLFSPTCQIGSHRAAVPRAWHPHSACTQALPRPLSTPRPRATKAPRNEEAPRQPNAGERADEPTRQNLKASWQERRFCMHSKTTDSMRC